ncbi:MAG: ABC transporter permease, partial [Defluviitaleaceae bacterium]|nr:ABC transporter permease [Defluviitaleaceae bacterium]
MSFFDIFAMAVRNLFKRRVRTALTLGGVIIGTAAITIMMSLGIAVNMSFQAQIEAIGHEALRIEIWSNTWDPMNRRTIEMRDVEAVSRLPNVAAATPFLETNLTFLSGRYLASIWVTGILPEAMDAMGIEIAEGRMLDSTDGFALVMGSQIPYEFRTAREMERNRGGFGGGGVMIAGRGGGFTVISPGGMGMGGGIDRTRNVDVLSARFQASFVHGFGNPNAPAPTGPRVIPYQVDVVGVLGGDNWQAQRTSYMPLDQVIQVIEDRVAHERRQGNTNPWNPLEDGFQNMHIFATEVRYVDGIVEELEAMGFTNVFTQLSWINHL